MAIWVREWSPSFLRILPTWFAAVRSEIESSLAIWRLVSPRATRRAITCSLAVSLSVGGSSATGGCWSGTETSVGGSCRRSFKPLLQRAGLPQIRFHDLRHTCATLLLSCNTNPKLVQALLGHATVAITLDTYSHIIPGMRDLTARTMEDIFS